MSFSAPKKKPPRKSGKKCCTYTCVPPGPRNWSASSPEACCCWGRPRPAGTVRRCSDWNRTHPRYHPKLISFGHRETKRQDEWNFSRNLRGRSTEDENRIVSLIIRNRNDVKGAVSPRRNGVKWISILKASLLDHLIPSGSDFADIRVGSC